jgi:hypothetical protein
VDKAVLGALMGRGVNARITGEWKWKDGGRGNTIMRRKEMGVMGRIVDR